jgi:hypothetical protein
MGKIKIRRIALVAVFIFGATVIPLLQSHVAFATGGPLEPRSLTLQTGTDPGSKPGGVVKHYFQFTTSAYANTVGSIQFMYCTTASGTCTMPTGLVTTSATLTGQTGATGFTINATTNGTPYITRTASLIALSTALTYTFSNITNPTGTQQSFYVRISTFASIDTTGVPIDTGNVAAATATQIVLTGTMPESLIFCAGATIGVTNTIPDCSTATAGTIAFSAPFSPASTATATSQMAASTNAGTGYTISVGGATMTNGSNPITAMGTSGVGIHGKSQFGLNLVANTVATSTPAVGVVITPTSNGTNLRGEPLTGYGTIDNFQYIAPGPTNIADSGQGGLGGTDAQIYTVSYIVNVPGSQPAGTYTATLTYICTPTF